MMPTRGAVCAIVITALGGPAFGQAAKSLNTCQKTVAVESAKYVRSMANSVGQCLQKMSTRVIKKGDATAQAANVAAASCVAAFRKIVNSDAPAKQLGSRFEAKLGAKCDPTVNPDLPYPESATYTVGATTLGAANLNAYCATLGGDGTIDSFAEWRTCLRAAADAEARAAITASWPRALEYFEALLPAIAALPSNSKTADALSAMTQLDAAIEGPVEDNAPDSPAKTGLLKTGYPSCLPGSCARDLGTAGMPNDDARVNAGLATHYTDNQDGTITDQVTGLTWEKLSDDGSIHDRDTTYTFAGAFTTKLTALNAGSGFAGHTDWRVPNRRELDSLVDIGRYAPSPIIRSIFDTGCAADCSVLTCSCAAAGRYWSSTSLQNDASAHWAVDFSNGWIVASASGGAESFGVRAVRGGVSVPPLPAPVSTGEASASLNTCQKTVATQSARYVDALAGGIGRCLGKISTAVIKNGATTAAAATSTAKSCVSILRTIVNTDAPAKQLGSSFLAKVAAKCDPGINSNLAHPEADTYTIGTHKLSAAKLGAYCLQLGGDAGIDSFAKWSTCVRRVAEAEAQEAITLRWPRALEYMGALQTAISAAPASAKNTDALAALAVLDAKIDGATVDAKPDPPLGPPAGLLVSGQTQCAQNDLSMGACPGGLSGQDGELRAGVERRYTDNGDGTITDNVTGLMWEKLSDDDSIHDRDHVYGAGNWHWGVFLNKIPRLNRHSFAGYNDWRLPNRREIESLVDAGRVAPAVDPLFDHDCTPGCSVQNCSCTAPGPYASSNHYFSPSGLDYWQVDFNDGAVYLSDSSAMHVRAVRGGNIPATIYVNQAPVAESFNVSYPWKQFCNSVTLRAVDDSTMVWPHIATPPTYGYITEYVSDAIPVALPDRVNWWGPSDDDWGFSFAVSGIAGRNIFTYCYVPFNPNFVGFDSFQYQAVDDEGLYSNVATVSIEIYQN